MYKIHNQIMGYTTCVLSPNNDARLHSEEAKWYQSFQCLLLLSYILLYDSFETGYIVYQQNISNCGEIHSILLIF